MQVQSVVMSPPDRADTSRLLEDDGLEPARVQLMRGRKAGRPGADDDSVWTGHALQPCV